MIGDDKIQHFTLWLISSIVVGFFTGWMTGFLVAMVVGIAKEIYDYVSGKGHCELGDLIADFLGSAVGAYMIFSIGIPMWWRW